MLVSAVNFSSKGRSVQISRSATQPGDTGSLDADTRAAIARFRFEYPLERQFQDAYLERNLPRARFATAIYLGLVLVMTAINLLGGLAPLAEAALQPIYILRIGVACPA